MERDTKQHILWAALKRSALHPFDPLTLEGVAKDVGITKAALYRYFPSKEELISSLKAECTVHQQAVFRRMQGNAKENLEVFTDALIEQRGHFTIIASQGFSEYRLDYRRFLFLFSTPEENIDSTCSTLTYRFGIYFPLVYQAVELDNLMPADVPDFLSGIHQWFGNGLGIPMAFDQKLWSSNAVAPATFEEDRYLDGLYHVFETYGLRNLTMKRMADELGIVPSSLYYRYVSKEAMVSEICKKEVSRYLTLLDRRLSVKLTIIQALHIIFATADSYFRQRIELSRWFFFMQVASSFVHEGLFAPYRNLSIWMAKFSVLKKHAGELALFLSLLPCLQSPDDAVPLDLHARRMLSLFTQGSCSEVS